jgi:HTH-type transcriptional regulator, competence development regulator
MDLDFYLCRMKNLGATLKEARELFPLTLRQVEEATGISNAYLSQLENNKIKKPSANVLYKLASIYKIELNELLSAAGIIQDTPGDQPQGKADAVFMKKLAVYSNDFSADQQKEILDFIKYMKFKNKNN